MTDLWFGLFRVYCLFVARNIFLLFVNFIFSDYGTSKLTCFLILQRMFTWDPCYDAAVRQKFDTKARNILKRALYDLREERTHFVFIGAEHLASMKAKWALADWKEKSKAGRKARRSKEGKGKALYTGGSVSTAVHKSRMVSIYSYK